MEQVIAFVMDLAMQYPKLAAVVMIMGAFRLVFKPLFAGVEAYILDSPSKNDDLMLEKIKSNMFFKAFIFIIDYAFSIKMKK